MHNFIRIDAHSAFSSQGPQKARDTLRILHVDVSPVTGIVLWKGAYLPFGSGAV